MSALLGDVLVVAPPTLQRQGLLLMLRQTWPHLAVALAADSQQAQDLLDRHAYQLVIADALLPCADLVRLLARLPHTHPGQRLLVLTDPHSAPCPAPPHPALTVAPPSATPEDVLLLVAGLLGSSAAPAAGSRARPRCPATPFSRRELEVLRLVVGDYCNRQIAERLCLSVRTVESHRRALLQKTGTRSLVGLVVQAVREGWVAA